MKVYVFGNEYVVGDKRTIEVAKELDDSVEGISFVFVRPNEDLPVCGRAARGHPGYSSRNTGRDVTRET
jgi:hypothetical protein